ncbi:MAG: GMC family oxidoreductase [Candidatus Acidiferrales bacterium]
MAEERSDVLVIGSGPAGAAVTKRLTDLGAKVVCLEQGDWVNPADYPSTRQDWETATIRGPFHFNPNVRKRPEDYPVVAAGEHPREVQLFNAVGGTIHWGAHFPRPHPSDFRVRSLDGVADDWPIRYEDLERYYDMNDREMGVSGVSGDPQNPPRSARPTPPLSLGEMGKTIGSGFDKLGWYWWVSDNGIISRFYDGRLACEMHGKCQLGCPMRAKATADVTYWPKALKKGAVLKTWARVREITLDAQGRARGALYYDQQGNLKEQLASVVVVSCNGVGTPRLLLNSKSKLFPEGLANSSGMVGKCFMGHAHQKIEGIFDQPMNSEEAPPYLAFSQQFYETDLTRGFVRGYTIGVQRKYGPLEHARGGKGMPPVPWGVAHHGAMRKRYPHVIQLGVLGEDLPDENNRVELDPAVTDSNGIPAARVIYSWNENSVKLLEHSLRMGRQLLEAAGAVEISSRGIDQSAAHLMGTARMGSDPKRSVVNAWNQAHDVKNLYVVDGSSFTTSASVNPTSTIGALALRAADGIWEHRRDWS